MATLLQLAAKAELYRLDPQLSANQQELRVLFASLRFTKWARDELPALGSTWNIETSPVEQMDAFMETYASGETLSFRRAFSPISHIRYGAWELKTADLRLFGWFAARDCFVAVMADTAERVKLHRLYHGYAGEVVRFRDAIDLDEPKYVAGDDPDAVVSNFCYP